MGKEGRCCAEEIGRDVCRAPGADGNPRGLEEASNAATASGEEVRSDKGKGLADSKQDDEEVQEASPERESSTGQALTACKMWGAVGEACARPCSLSAPSVSLCEPSAPDDEVAASFMEEEDARRSDVSGRMADTSTHGECEGGGGGGGGSGGGRMADTSTHGECEGRSSRGSDRDEVPLSSAGGHRNQGPRHDMDESGADGGLNSSSVDCGKGGDDDDDVGANRAQELVTLETLLDREMAPQKFATSLRIRLESAHRDIWPLFRDQHYRGGKENQLQCNAHVYVATLPDHGNAIVGMVSTMARPGRGNGIKDRTHRGHWREYRLVVLPGYQGCGIG